MYYDDQARRFNLLSGLLSGAVLGAGIALLLRPEARSGATRRLLVEARDSLEGARSRARGRFRL